MFEREYLLVVGLAIGEARTRGSTHLKLKALGLDLPKFIFDKWQHSLKNTTTAISNQSGSNYHLDFHFLS